MSDWGQGANNNSIGWGQGAVNNTISWGKSHEESYSGDTNIVGQETQQTFYVRPAGSTYGTGDGTSYANAWSGQADLTANAATLEGNKLVICDTHTERISMVCNLNELSFDTVTSVGKIDATGFDNGLEIIGFDITDFTNSDVQNSDNGVTGTNIYMENTTINFTGLHNFSNSLNQGMQHWTNANITYKSGCEIIADNCGDEGLSGHETANVVFEAGSILRCHNNTQAGINYVQQAKFTLNGIMDFSGNGQYDIWATNNSGSNVDDLQLNIGSSSQLGIVKIDGGQINTDGANIADLNLGNDSEANIANSFIGEVIGDTFTGAINTTNNTYIGAIGSDLGTSYNFADSYIKVSGPYQIDSNFVATRTLFDGDTATLHTLNFSSGADVSINHCVFINTQDTRFCILIQTGVTVNYIDNITTYLGAGTGRGIFSDIDITINNCILSSISLPLFAQTGATITANSCNFFDSAAFGGGGTVTNNNEVTGDPLFEDVLTNDFRLGVGSPCIGAGVTTTNTEGIDTADWGNGTTEKPIVTSKTQTAPFDVGAYVD